MLNFVSTAQATFSRRLTNHIAGRLGENESRVSSALASMLAVVLAGCVNQAKAGNAQLVYDLSQQAHRAAPHSFGTVTGVLGILGAGQASGSALLRGERALLALFGPASSTLAGLIGGHAGIRRASADALWNLVGAVLPAILGHHVAQGHLSAEGLGAALLSHKLQVRGLLPQGVAGLKEALQFGRVSAVDSRPAARQRWVVVAMQHRTTAVAGAGWYRAIGAFLGVWAVAHWLMSRSQAAANPASWQNVALPSGQFAAVEAGRFPDSSAASAYLGTAPANPCDYLLLEPETLPHLLDQRHGFGGRAGE